jgi:hypothetical protein
MIGQSEAVILVFGALWGPFVYIYIDRPMPKDELKLIFTQLEGCCCSTLFLVLQCMG